MVDLDPPQIVKPGADTSLQDGLLQWYLTQAPMQDAQVEARVEREPFFLDSIYGGMNDSINLLEKYYGISWHSGQHGAGQKK